MKRRYKLVPVLFIMLFAFGAVSPVLAAAEISPENPTLIAGMPFQFTVTGLTASTAYGVTIDAGTTWEFNGTSDASGDATFTITLSDSGDFTLGVYEVAVLKDSVAITVIDLIEMIMPYVILIVTLSVLFGVVGMIQGMIKWKK